MRGSYSSSLYGTAPHQSILEGKARKLAPIIAPIVFAVALIICVMLAQNREVKPAHHYAHSHNRLSQSTVSIICKHTTYPDVCVQELSSLRIPQTASPLEVVTYAVQAAATRANEGHTLATKCSRENGLSLLEGQCADDCVELLDSVRDQLNLALSRLSGLGTLNNVDSLRNALMDVKVWLSSSLSYQTVCTDNFQEAPGNIQEQIQSNQAYFAEVVGNALSLVDILSKVGNDVTSWLGALPPSPTFIHFRRRLLSSPASSGTSDQSDHTSVDPASFSSSGSILGLINDGDEFPYWVSAAERKLLQSSSSSVDANAVVAQDGSGNYGNITEALNAIPGSFSGRYVIYIKQGVYAEVFNVTKDQKNITFVGDGIGKTVITGDRNVASGQYNTYRTSTVGISGSGFYARDLTFRNTAGASGHQAVAVRAGADFMVFYHCSFEGYQDTLYALTSRQFYRECQISGTVDFIFGNAIAVFQNCELLARLPMQGQQNTYTAQGRKLESDISGYSFQNCTVTGDSSLQNASYSVSTYLGRPWKAYSRVVFLQSDIEALVDPQGWLPWNSSNPYTDTLYYGEYDNRGPGSSTSQRVDWVGVHPNMTASEASQFTVDNFIAGGTWLSALQVAYQASLS